MIEVGTKVAWAGVQDYRCAPGFTGHVEKISHKDENSIRVFWNERGSYTWERRKNLRPADDEGVGVREPRRPHPPKENAGV